MKGVRAVILKAVRWDLLGDPHGENRDTRGVKIETVNKKKNIPALGRDRTKPIGRYRELQGTGNLMRGMKNLSDCTDW